MPGKNQGKAPALDRRLFLDRLKQRADKFSGGNWNPPVGKYVCQLTEVKFGETLDKKTKEPALWISLVWAIDPSHAEYGAQTFSMFYGEKSFWKLAPVIAGITGEDVDPTADGVNEAFESLEENVENWFQVSVTMELAKDGKREFPQYEVQSYLGDSGEPEEPVDEPEVARTPGKQTKRGRR